MKCPICKKSFVDKGRSKGGKAGTGKAKARTKAQARAAAKARWDKARAVRQNKDSAAGKS
jgi:hypothetical protein